MTDISQDQKIQEDIKRRKQERRSKDVTAFGWRWMLNLTMSVLIIAAAVVVHQGLQKTMEEIKKLPVPETIEKIVEKTVEVPVEKIIQVPVNSQDPKGFTEAMFRIRQKDTRVVCEIRSQTRWIVIDDDACLAAIRVVLKDETTE